jgi:hypothetical protein
LRDFQDEKADVILKYTADEARQLKNKGQIPENVNRNIRGLHVISFPFQEMLASKSQHSTNNESYKNFLISPWFNSIQALASLNANTSPINSYLSATLNSSSPLNNNSLLMANTNNAANLTANAFSRYITSSSTFSSAATTSKQNNNQMNATKNNMASPVPSKQSIAIILPEFSPDNCEDI